MLRMGSVFDYPDSASVETDYIRAYPKGEPQADPDPENLTIQR